MATTGPPLLTWLTKISAPLFAWLAKNFPSPSSIELQKVTQALLFNVGSVVPLALGWNANGDVDHEKACVCHTHYL
jgi:hypothetical protein